ncbi:S8 family peptidase [Noviluteimonas gilva]|uniref:S8 family serine peptidase n=1 Tax=Noviluteimonas gilva TaxID=2682097 RepID=A0A7C9M596_9GAMM|nr:S8 family peptidase [Lysobacter gilvus]MUV15262.1 S8 family serine peptidase [Lysobacter gilvus]
MTLIKQTSLCVALCGIVFGAGAGDLSTATKQRASTTRFAADTPTAPSAFARFIIKPRSGATAEALFASAAQRAGVRQSAASALTVKRVRTMSRGAAVVRTSRALSLTESDALLAQLRSDPGIAWAQPDYMKQRMDTVPNDTHFATLQWDFTHPQSGIGAPQAWDTTTGTGVVVAVLDTGVVDHADMASNLVPGYDFVSWYGQVEDGMTYPNIAGDGDGRDADARDPGDFLTGMEGFCNGAVSDSSWHGTHVAGTIAAVTNNAKGVAGVAYGAKVQPVRVLGRCGGLTSDIADAITWASGGDVPGVPRNPTPAEVLNLSLGGFQRCIDDPATQDAIDGALARGTSVVVAAGNANTNAASFSPASCRGVITVGATGVDGARSWYSNYGPNVMLSAPGGNANSGGAPDDAWIWSLGNSSRTTPAASPGGDVVMAHIGTSMAAPHVAGAVALIQSAAVGAGHAPLSPGLVAQVLRATVKPFVVQPSTTTPVGSGILDLPAAVAVAASGANEADLALPLASRGAVVGQAAGSGASSLYRITVPAGATQLNVRTYGGTGDVSLYLSRDTVPSTTAYGWRSSHAGIAEAIVVSRPGAGVYYVRVQGEQASSGFTVLASW